MLDVARTKTNMILGQNGNQCRKQKLNPMMIKNYELNCEIRKCKIINIKANIVKQIKTRVGETFDI